MPDAGIASAAILKQANWAEIEVREKMTREHKGDIPRVKSSAQRRNWANWPFMDGHGSIY